MAGTVFFVDGLNPDRQSRKLMRRHVMKGKNSGRKISRPSKQSLRARTGPQHDAVSTLASLYGSRAIISQPWNRPFATFSAPYDVSPAALGIFDLYFSSTVDRLYPAVLGFASEDAKMLYAGSIFKNEATFTCNVAVMSAANELYANNGFCSSAALYYLSQTYKQLQLLLCSDEATSDTMIMILLSLVHQELMRDSRDAATIHFEGVQSVVKLRGGLNDLKNNQLLLLKVHKTDILLALRDFVPSTYFRDSMTEIRRSVGLHAHLYPADQGQEQYLDRIFQDAFDLCSVFDSNERTRLLDVCAFQETIVSLCSRLLRLQPRMEVGMVSATQRVKHVSLLIFTMTSFIRYGPKRVFYFRKIGHHFREVLNDGMNECDADLLLWAIVIGGIWTFNSSDDEWVVRQLQILAEASGIHEWDDARRILARFPWVQVLHDKPGYDLWKKAFIKQ